MNNIQDCIRFANENPICYLATTEGDQPRVRGMGIWFADNTGFYFQTSNAKDIPHQLLKNPNAEVCFYQQKGVTGTMLRISGRAEFVHDREFKEKAVEDRPFLKSMGFSADAPELILFKIAHGEALVWTMESNLKPKQPITF